LVILPVEGYKVSPVRDRSPLVRLRRIRRLWRLISNGVRKERSKKTFTRIAAKIRKRGRKSTAYLGLLVFFLVLMAEPAGETARARDWKYIVIHHSATEVGNATIFDREHQRRGFRDGLAYHFVISNGTSGLRDGQIEVGHRWRNQIDGSGTRSTKMQRSGIGICLVGNFEYQFVSERQFASLIWLIEELQRHYDIPLENIVRHKDVDRTACPGRNFPWSRLKRTLRERAASRLM
jgi:hypothetical protein